MTPANRRAEQTRRAKADAAKSIAALARANDNSVRFHLDGHEVDEETFLGYRPLPISMEETFVGPKPSSLPQVPQLTVEERVSRRICDKIERGFDLLNGAETISDIHKSHRIARETQAALTTYEWLTVPPFYAKMLDEIVDAADQFDQSQRTEIAMAKWMRVGVLVAICCLLIPVLASFAPRLYRSDIVMGSLVFCLIGSAIIALKGVR